MRVGKPASRVLDLQIASTARTAAGLVNTARNPAHAVARFLVLFADGLQSGATASARGVDTLSTPSRAAASRAARPGQ